MGRFKSSRVLFFSSSYPCLCSQGEFSHLPRAVRDLLRRQQLLPEPRAAGEGRFRRHTEKQKSHRTYPPNNRLCWRKPILSLRRRRSHISGLNIRALIGRNNHEISSFHSLKNSLRCCLFYPPVSRKHVVARAV